MNISDAVRIIQNSPDTLQIYFPPRLAGGIGFLILAAILAALAFKLHERKWMLVLDLVFVAGLLFGGLDMCTYHANVVLSSKAQTFSYEEKTFYYRTAKTLPLSSVEQAIVEAGSTQNRRFVLLVATQPSIPLGDGYNSRGNQFAAARAVNAFIARNAKR